MKLLVRVALAVVCALGFNTVAQAQTTTITASHIYMGGVLIASGTVTFTPVGTNGVPISFAMGGGGLNSPAFFPCTITTGAISGTCSIPDSALTTPANILYSIQVTDTTSGKAFTLQVVPNITGSTWALDAYGPPATTTNVQQIQSAHGTAPAPNPCLEPSFYIRDSGGGQLFMCVAGLPVQVTGGGSGVTLPSTTEILKGNGSGGATPAAASDLASALSGQTGCTTSGYGWIPATNTCTPPNAATTPATTLLLKGNGSTNGVTVAAPGVDYALPGANLAAIAAQPTPASTTLLQALNNARNVPIHIAVMGDSFTVACQPLSTPGTGPVSCASRWPEQIRVQLQSIYGSHGTGVYPVMVATGSVINNQAWSCTGGFTTSNILGPTQGSDNTLISLGPSASCTFHDNRNIAWDTLNTYCGTNGTSVGIAVNIDSGAFTGTACGTTTGSAAAHVVTLAATSSTSHSVTFTNTAGSGNAYLYAAEGQSGTTGVSVDVMGLGGATAGAFGATATTQLAFSDLIPGGTKALIYMDQTNDASLGVATGTFSTNVQNLITHEQALASAPTVVLAIPPVDIINGTHSMAPYTAIQNGLCTSNALTCINIQSRGTTVGSTVVGWGTTFPGCPNSLWDCTGSSAGIHPNDAGNLDEAQMIYAALVNPVGVGTAPCTANCTISTTLTVSAGSASVVANTNGSSLTAGTTYNVPGLNQLSANGWGTGNGAGLAGAFGLFDSTTSHFVWNTNTTDDFCGNTPVSNVVACTSSTWKILHTGDATVASVKATVYTVATLPSASSLAAGTQVVVSDATTFTPGTCTGGGSDYMIAITNGTTWSCH